MKKVLQLKNGNTMVIRRGSKDDRKEILNYIHTISRESDFLTFGEGEFTQTLEETEAFIDRFSKLKNGLYIVAEIDGKIVGNLSFSGGPRPRIAHIGEFGVTVLKEYWGLGIGTKLLNYLIDWSKESGIRKINLRVRTDNHSAISVYKKLGFKEEGVITRDFLINNKFYDSILMGLCID